MRLLRILIAVLCLVAGLLVGVLNPQTVSIDLGWVTLYASLGVTLLVTLLCGVVVGGLILTVSVVLPLRQRLRRAQAPVGASAAPPPDRGHGA